MNTSIDKVFGYTTIVRFDWQTTKSILGNKRRCSIVDWLDINTHTFEYMFREDGENGSISGGSKSLLNFFGKSTNASADVTSVPRNTFFVDRKIKSVTKF
jgi:hypothetical protein